MKKTKILMMISLTLLSVSLVSFGTYAIWISADDILSGDTSISSGEVKMSYTESNEIGLNNALPIKDDEGMKSTTYFEFSVMSYIKTKVSDSTERKINYNIVVEPLAVENRFPDSAIKVYLTKVVDGSEIMVVEPTTIDEFSQYVIKSQEEIFKNNNSAVTTTYRLRVWLDFNVDASNFGEKSYSYKFRVNVNNDAAPNATLTAIKFARSKLGSDGLELVTHEIDDTLQVDSKFAKEYRYRGGDSVVKNYVTFNNEIWRIIGIFPTEDTDNNISYRFKLIKDTSVGSYAWNTTIDSTSNSYNNWTSATLNTYLNEDYYNTLNDDAQNMIGTAKYYLGGYSSLRITSDVMWQYERKNETNRSGYYYGTNPIMQSDADKKIAIMYVSDYGYAASASCTTILYYPERRDDTNCKAANNWTDKTAYTWLLGQYSGNGDDGFYLDKYGYVSSRFGAVSKYGNDTVSMQIRPVLYLTSNIKIATGTDTSSDPYTLSL